MQAWSHVSEPGVWKASASWRFSQTLVESMALRRGARWQAGHVGAFLQVRIVDDDAVGVLAFSNQEEKATASKWICTLDRLWFECIAR